jgi:hypothetical protein
MIDRPVANMNRGLDNICIQCAMVIKRTRYKSLRFPVGILLSAGDVSLLAKSIGNVKQSETRR